MSNKRRGFTIVEVLVATFLLSIVVAVPLTQIFIRTNFKVRRMQTALSMEKDLLERIRVLPYNSPAISDDGDVSDIDDTVHPDHVVDTVRVNTMRIVRFYNVVDNIPQGEMKTVKVFVKWNDPLIDTVEHVISAVTIKNARW